MSAADAGHLSGLSVPVICYASAERQMVLMGTPPPTRTGGPPVTTLNEATDHPSASFCLALGDPGDFQDYIY